MLRQSLKRAGQTVVLFALAVTCSLLAASLGINKESLIMVYLLGVLFITVSTSSYVCGILSAVAAVLAFNFLFTAPLYTFAISSRNDIVLLVFFLVTAIVCGRVTSRLQQQMELAAKNERAAQELYRVKSEQEEIRLAMEQERLRSTLLRSVAHDLRTPLTALSGAGHLLADNYDSLSGEERVKLASDISEEIVWLTNLVENILSMTRINDGQLVLRKDEEVVDDVVSEAIGHMKRLMGNRQFRVSLPDQVVTAPMDGRLIVQVLTNLLENAIRHTGPEAEILLTAHVDGAFLEFMVSDQGCGIDPEVRDRLFDRFVSLDRGVVDGRPGIGLGLAICRAIVEAHGGTIRAEDNQPHGARFLFTLPMEESNG